MLFRSVLVSASQQNEQGILHLQTIEAVPKAVVEMHIHSSPLTGLASPGLPLMRRAMLVRTFPRTSRSRRSSSHRTHRSDCLSANIAYSTPLATATQRCLAGSHQKHHILRTLPLSGRQGDCGGVAKSWWWPVHSRGLLSVLYAETLLWSTS